MRALLSLLFFLQAPAVFQRQGEAAFREGRFAESVANFDKVIAAIPDQAAHHWQRGISLYYAGRFKDCRDQFQLHRTVNPEDFENAAWHLLCNARIDGFENARKNLIATREDGRVPMRELFRLYKGEGSVEQVLKASARDETSEFYANLYLALYEEARGRRDASKPYAKKANDLADAGYMGDVARVHWKQLAAGKLP
jgi:lipoprotein NlpI